MKDLQTKEEFVRLRALGLSFNRIAEQLATSRRTLIEWSRQMALEIRNQRAAEHEALLEQLALNREGRVRFLGDLIKKVRQELASRSLASVSTEKLLDLSFKLGQEWKDIEPEVTFGTKVDPMESLEASLNGSVTSWTV